MKLSKKLSYILLIILSLYFIKTFDIAYSKNQISASQAINYIGRKGTVCGVVAGVKYARYSRGHPTFIDLGRPYPNQYFTLVIWGSDIRKFSNLERVFTPGNKICATGLIKSYRGKPDMILRSPSQISY